MDHANGRFVVKDTGKREQHATGAQRDTRAGKGRYDLISPVFLRRLARLYEAGAKKYGDRNWEQGMPCSRFLDSALRHLNDYRLGDRAEDHLVQAAWNLAAIVHFQELRPELNDLEDPPGPPQKARRVTRRATRPAR